MFDLDFFEAKIGLLYMMSTVKTNDWKLKIFERKTRFKNTWIHSNEYSISAQNYWLRIIWCWKQYCVGNGCHREFPYVHILCVIFLDILCTIPWHARNMKNFNISHVNDFVRIVTIFRCTIRNVYSEMCWRCRLVTQFD